MAEFDYYEDTTDSELWEEKRALEMEISKLQARAVQITTILNQRSVAILRREANKAIETKPSYGDFKAQLDAIGKEVKHEPN